jgi:hypothetical protein
MGDPLVARFLSELGSLYGDVYYFLNVCLDLRVNQHRQPPNHVVRLIADA